MLYIKRRWFKEKKEKEKREKKAKRDPNWKPGIGRPYKTFTKGGKALHIERLNRARYVRVERYILFFKVLIHTSYIENQFKALAAMFLSRLSKRVSITRCKNVCFIIGRRRSVYSFTRMNRLVMRENINKLDFPGLSIAKW